MKNTRLLLLLLFFITSNFINTSEASAAPAAQDPLVTIKLVNTSWMPLTAKLVGATSKAVKLNSLGIHRFRAKPGEHYLFYEFYNADAKKYFYVRTELFGIAADAGEIVVKADPNPTYMYEDGYNKRVLLLQSDFIKPPGWPTEPVTVESYPSFTSLKLIVAIQDLYLDDRDHERSYVTGVVKAVLNRVVARNILPPLRRQGFRVTHAGATNAKTLPATFAEPTLVMTYAESEGRDFFSMKGILIQCRLALYGVGSKQSEPIWEQEVTGTNRDSVRVNVTNANGSFRNDSLSDLKANFAEFEFDLSDWKGGK